MDMPFDIATGMLTPQEAEVFAAISQGKKPFIERPGGDHWKDPTFYLFDMLCGSTISWDLSVEDSWAEPTGLILVVNRLNFPLRLTGSADDRFRHGKESANSVDFTAPRVPSAQDLESPWRKAGDHATLPGMIEGQPGFGAWIGQKRHGAWVGADFALCFTAPGTDFALSVTLCCPHKAGGQTALISLDPTTDFKRKLDHDDARSSGKWDVGWTININGKITAFSATASVENNVKCGQYVMTVVISQV